MRYGPNTTCVVTGGLGFIGSHFIERALALGWTVVNIDKVTYASRSTDFGGHPKYSHVREDIVTIKSLPFCHLIVNFAAESHVDNSIDGSMPFVRSNFLGVHNLLEIIQRQKLGNATKSWPYKPPLLLQISTDEVFGDILEGSFKEDAPFNPSNPYSSTKASAEMLVVSWGRTYELPYLITRTTNNYGPHQHPEKLLPMAISKCLAGEKPVVHGTGEYVRNWIHVEDNVDAIMVVLQEGVLNESYHIASPEEYNVAEIITKVLAAFDKPYDGSTVDSSCDRSGADLRYALDTTKIETLGWHAKRRFDDELPKIIEMTRTQSMSDPVVISSFDAAFFTYAVRMYRSLLHFHPDWRIFCGDMGLTASQVAQIESLGVEVRRCARSAMFGRRGIGMTFCDFLSGEFLQGVEWDKVLWIDADTMILDDISELFSHDCEFTGHPGRSSIGPIRKFGDMTLNRRTRKWLQSNMPVESDMPYFSGAMWCAGHRFVDFLGTLLDSMDDRRAPKRESPVIAATVNHLQLSFHHLDPAVWNFGRDLVSLARYENGRIVYGDGVFPKTVEFSCRDDGSRGTNIALDRFYDEIITG